MRALLDCRMASWTGVGRYTRGLARGLAEYTDVEVVQVITRGEQHVPLDPAHAATIETGGHPFSRAGASELGRAIKTADPDVTHCLHFPTPRPATTTLAVTIHDLIPIVVPGVMTSPARRWVYKRHNARALRYADALITDSAHTARDIERVFPHSAPEAHVIPLAADDFTAGPVADLPAPVAALGGRTYVLGMGNTRPHKGLDLLVSAFGEVAASDPEVALVLVGAPERADDTGRIVETGRVSDDELRALYAGAAVFAFPSLYEGYGLPPLEAMAMGAPVICAKAASVPEVTGEAAMLVPPGDVTALADAIGRVLADDGLSADMVRAGRARAAELTWASTARQTARVYEELLDRP